jgi:hypothetical protein
VLSPLLRRTEGGPDVGVGRVVFGIGGRRGIGIAGGGGSEVSKGGCASKGGGDGDDTLR